MHKQRHVIIETCSNVFLANNKASLGHQILYRVYDQETAALLSKYNYLFKLRYPPKEYPCECFQHRWPSSSGQDSAVHLHLKDKDGAHQAAKEFQHPHQVSSVGRQFVYPDLWERNSLFFVCTFRQKMLQWVDVRRPKKSTCMFLVWLCMVLQRIQRCDLELKG